MLANNNNKWQLPDYEFRFIVTGAKGAGNTNFIRAITGQRFVEQYRPTLKSEFINHELDIDGKYINIQIWESLKATAASIITPPKSSDVDEESSNTAILPHEFSGANAIFFLFDINAPKSLDVLGNFIAEVNNFDISLTCLKIIIGTKRDQRSELSVSRQSIYALAKHAGMRYIEVSAKTRFNTDLLLINTASSLMGKALEDLHQKAKEKNKQMSLNIITPSEKKKSKEQPTNDIEIDKITEQFFNFAIRVSKSLPPSTSFWNPQDEQLKKEISLAKSIVKFQVNAKNAGRILTLRDYIMEINSIVQGANYAPHSEFAQLVNKINKDANVIIESQISQHNTAYYSYCY